MTATATKSAPAMRHASQSANARPSTRRQVSFGDIQPRGHAVLLYGPGGSGKTLLSANAPEPVAMIDLENSMPILKPQLSKDRDVKIVSGVFGWQEIRECLKADGWDGIRTLVLDSVTLAEQMCAAWVIKHVKHPDKKELIVERLEDYGWGRGPGFVYDEFLGLLSDLEIHLRAGRNVILVSHDCVTECPNPAGENWLRYEPRLQSPASGKNSIRLRVREWADHVLFLSYDVNVVDGKGQGGGTRSLHPVELPHVMAKSRTCDVVTAVVKNDPSVWEKIFKS